MPSHPPKQNINITTELERYKQVMGDWYYHELKELSDKPYFDDTKAYYKDKAELDNKKKFFEINAGKIESVLKLLNELDLSKVYTKAELEKFVDDMIYEYDKTYEKSFYILNAILATREYIKNDPNFLKYLGNAEQAQSFLFFHQRQVPIELIVILLNNNLSFKHFLEIGDETNPTMKEKFVKKCRILLESQEEAKKTSLKAEIWAVCQEVKEAIQHRDQIKSHKDSADATQRNEYWNRDEEVFKLQNSLKEKTYQLNKTSKYRFHTKLAILFLYQNDALSPEALSILSSSQLDKAFEFIKQTIGVDPFKIDDELKELAEKIAVSKRKIAALEIKDPSSPLAPSTPSTSSSNGSPVSESPPPFAIKEFKGKEPVETINDLKTIHNQYLLKEKEQFLLKQKETQQIIDNGKIIELEKLTLRNLEARLKNLKLARDERNQKLKAKVNETVLTYAKAVYAQTHEKHNPTVIITKAQFQRAVEIYNRNRHWARSLHTATLIERTLPEYFKNHAVYICSPQDVQHLFGSLNRNKVTQLFLGGDQRAFGKALREAASELDQLPHHNHIP